MSGTILQPFIANSLKRLMKRRQVHDVVNGVQTPIGARPSGTRRLQASLVCL